MFNPLWKFQRQRNSKIWKRWQLFHATDFQSLMYPWFTFSRILGIFPYKINASIFETSRSRYILLIIITCIISILQLTIIYYLIILNIRTMAFEIIQDVCFYSLQSFILIVSAILSGPRMRLLQIMLEVSSKLPRKSYEKLSKLIHIKDIFGLFFLMGQMLLAFVLIELFQEDYIIFYYISILIEHYSRSQIFQMDMLHINCVCILKACFQRIDDNLMNLRELMINDKSHVPRLIYYQQRNSLLLKELKILEKQYLIVSDTVQMLNIIFSPQLLATIATVFIEITFELYSNIVQWQNGKLSINLFNNKEINIFLILHIVFYISYYIIKMILLVWACETGKNQATKINTTIHEVLNSTSDEQIKDELRQFSLQTLHRDNTFSAKCFILNARLLTTMVGTITTYFLILIQFWITWYTCNEKTVTNITQST